MRNSILYENNSRNLAFTPICHSSKRGELEQNTMSRPMGRSLEVQRSISRGEHEVDPAAARIQRPGITVIFPNRKTALSGTTRKGA